MQKRWVLLLAILCIVLAVWGTVRTATLPIREDAALTAFAGKGARLRVAPDGTLLAWGDGLRSPLLNWVPYGWCRVMKRDIVEVKASFYTILALDRDGTLWAWGEVPDSLSGAAGACRVLEEVTSFSVWDMQMAAVTRDGTLWSWGGPFEDLTAVCGGCRSALPVGGTLFIVERDGTLSALEDGERRVLAEQAAQICHAGVSEEGLLFLVLDTGGVLRQLTFDREESGAARFALSRPLDTGVTALCGHGYLKEDYTLWGWSLCGENAGELVRLAGSVSSAALSEQGSLILHRSGLLERLDEFSGRRTFYPLALALAIPVVPAALILWGIAAAISRKVSCQPSASVGML